ncbi:adenosylcobinamide-GDP ribazoletransferase [Agrobacterium larrymoorei]|uniref:Adenosylcobinamide-GDP ribazoletransferase n=1 Tax=Agrobacterium larrymoorei TaxID=160699 RepID=A0A4D7DTM5_9HYPH|nr:adenosylcobinamide-GDP ribazoletransferase [Agrobacterium larrymoorei]QCI97602.1 adenosylcobinamide-GDP ribazoletransferase [Agrobacterium larrymoorei]QYA06956.1 adenosylcobinamide-GDP ribazoletransferase [Agrobacterium larrymoorei]
MQPDGFVTKVMRALSFLSRIPVHDIFFENQHGDMVKTVRVFPLAGLIIALAPACLAAILTHFHADALLSAAIILALATAITGALHEDGLADTADGFGGGATRERALEIMKDSRIGSYGVIALILSFLIRAAAIAALIHALPPLGVAASLLGTACISRGLMVWHWSALPAAREGGVAASIGQPGTYERNGALCYGGGIAILIALPFYWPSLLVLAAGAAFAATYLFNRKCERKIQGHTGDTIGATQQITEIVMLAALALVA